MVNDDSEYKFRVGTEEQEIDELSLSQPGSTMTVTMKFFFVDIVRTYALLPDQRDPVILPEIRRPYCPQPIKFPVYSRCDQAMARIHAIEFLKSVAIPKHINAEILEEIDCVLTGELDKEIKDQKVKIVVGISKVRWKELNYNEYEELAMMASLAEEEVKPIPASEESIEALEKVILDDSEGCIVCMEDFESGTERIRMPCSHNYHQDCIVNWLQYSRSCPVCRYEMPPKQQL